MKKNNYLKRLALVLSLSVGLFYAGFFIFAPNSETSNNVKTSGINAIKKTEGIEKEFSGTYENITETYRGVVKIKGPFPDGRVEFSILKVTSDGCFTNKSGLSYLEAQNISIYNDVSSRCNLQFEFTGSQVIVTESSCNLQPQPQEDENCSLAGVYDLK